MYTTRKMDLGLEALKYLVLAMLATALALLMVGTLYGAPATAIQRPDMLPADMPHVAMPMEEPPWLGALAAEPQMPAVTPEMHDRLWRVLQLHRDRQPAEALMHWQQLALPPHTAAYKPMAMAVAEMQQNHLPAAERLLRDARDLAPRDPLVAYFTGILRMEQAAACEAKAPPVGPQFAAYMPWEANEQRAMLELAAIMEFRDAIEWADTVDYDVELMPDPQAANLGPLVTDLMTALGADNFVGKAHNVLGDLLLRRGALTEAEQHIDAAVAAGVPVLFAYEDLGLLYELQGRNADVVRVYGKNFELRWGPYLQNLKAWIAPEGRL